jgi:hypothetical protein
MSIRRQFTAARAGRQLRCMIFISVSTASLLIGTHAARGQVGPAEIKNTQLKALAAEYLPQLVSMREEIANLWFPYPLFLSRYVGLDPKQQAAADARGLEFVHFHDRAVLKTSGNYNAAFDSALLTQNQRACRVFEEVIAPILRLLPGRFGAQANFDRFGFEISYHVRMRSGSYDYEGKEILAVVMDKPGALGFPGAQTGTARQKILNASEIYVNGEEFGLVLQATHPLGSDELGTLRQVRDAGAAVPSVVVSPPVAPTAPPRNAEALQTRLQSQLDALGKAGIAHCHFVDYAPPSFVNFRNRIHLQMTMRNPSPYDRNTTSIYNRAARSFDLFLAPLLKSLLEWAPVADGIAGFDITVLNQFGSDSKDSPEALEFVFPLELLRRFIDAEITNQDLINQGVVLVNGVRIALDLQRTE